MIIHIVVSYDQNISSIFLCEKWIPFQASTSVLCLHYRPETVHCSTKDVYTSEITFLALQSLPLIIFNPFLPLLSPLIPSFTFYHLQSLPSPSIIFNPFLPLLSSSIPSFPFYNIQSHLSTSIIFNPFLHLLLSLTPSFMQLLLSV